MKSQLKIKGAFALVVLLSLLAVSFGPAQASGSFRGYDDSYGYGPGYGPGYDDSYGGYGGGYYGGGYGYADPYYSGYGNDYYYYSDYNSRVRDKTFVDFPLPQIRVQQPRPLIPFHPDQYYDYVKIEEKFLDPFYYKKFDSNFYEKHQLEYLIKYNKIPFYPYY